MAGDVQLATVMDRDRGMDCCEEKFTYLAQTVELGMEDREKTSLQHQHWYVDSGVTE